MISNLDAFSIAEETSRIINGKELCASVEVRVKKDHIQNIWKVSLHNFEPCHSNTNAFLDFVMSFHNLKKWKIDLDFDINAILILCQRQINCVINLCRNGPTMFQRIVPCAVFRQSVAIESWQWLLLLVVSWFMLLWDSGMTRFAGSYGSYATPRSRITKYSRVSSGETYIYKGHLDRATGRWPVSLSQTGSSIWSADQWAPLWPMQANTESRNHIPW